MILDTLREICTELKESIISLLSLLREAKVPIELSGYQEYIIAVCENDIDSIDECLVNIELTRPELLDDILSDIQQATMHFRVLSSIYATPILRSLAADRLSLSILNWLQVNHPETHDHPSAIGDGSVSVWPTQPQLYMFPQQERRGLLFQPLLFHEYGHVLYAVHKLEMDNLVADLQREISDLLIPKSQRNDLHSTIQSGRRQVVVDTWYSWIQELFCDAVGFQIGGPCFLYAFSSFLSIGRNHYYRQPKDLELSAHPVTWLRIHFLAHRARKEGFIDLANYVEEEWLSFAKVLELHEDYHGFYDKSLNVAINQAIDDMLIEANPQKGSVRDLEGISWENGDSPVRLLNWAWQVKLHDKQAYSKWETKHIEKFLRSKTYKVTLDPSISSKALVLPQNYEGTK